MLLLKTPLPFLTFVGLLSLAAVAILIAPGFATPQESDIVFPHEWVGDIDQDDFEEPSGICWHVERGTLFVVGDEGHLSKIEVDGTEINHKRIRKSDFEGVTHDPATGLLYVAVEGDEAVLEVDPGSFKVLREFALLRKLNGRTVMSKKGQGIEAITFVPDPAHPQGGIFHVANQAFTLTDDKDLSAVFQVELPLKDKTGKPKLLGYFEPGIIDLSGLNYDAASGILTLISDVTNTFHQYNGDGDLLCSYAFPGDNQEGITMDDEGAIYVAQDSGGIIKLRPIEN